MPTTQHLCLMLLSFSVYKLCNRLWKSIVILCAEYWNWLLLWNLFWYLLVRFFYTLPYYLSSSINHCYSPFSFRLTFLTAATDRQHVWCLTCFTQRRVLEKPQHPIYYNWQGFIVMCIRKSHSVCVCKIVLVFLFFFLFKFLLFFCHGVSQCSPAWPGTHRVAQRALEHEAVLLA